MHMLHGCDILTLNHYYSSPTGRASAHLLQRAIARHWQPIAQNERICCVGYAVPWLEWLDAQSHQLCHAMPASLGSIQWPTNSASRCLMHEDDHLPLARESLNRILLVHALEHTRHISTLLYDCWRALVPMGRVLLIVPHRRGMWVRNAHTPFGHGVPYTNGQITRAAHETGFEVIGRSSALFAPPVQPAIYTRIAPAMEWAGRLFMPFAGGVLLLALEKQVYAGILEPVRKKRLLNSIRQPGYASANATNYHQPSHQPPQ